MSWDQGVWQALARTLAEPLRKAFDDHMKEHQCVVVHCDIAYELFRLLPDGDKTLVATF